jgi:hypothetical protein
MIVPLIPAHPQTRGLPYEIELDIPSQPLDDALIAYGAATGLQVFYDGGLTVGRRSAAIKGIFPPMPGLQALLRGTGYVPQATANPDTITIVSAPPKQSLAPAAAEAAQLRRYEPYLAALQARISEALCASDQARPGDQQIVLSFWVNPLGAISRAVMLGSNSDLSRRDTIAAAMQGLRIEEPPPAGLPQPLTMVIFPPLAGEPTGCLSSKSYRANN